MSVYLMWLAAAVACLLLEALGISGVGFLFAGLGALTAGVALYLNPDLTILSQWVVFFISAVLWAIILWKPLQKFRIRRNGGYKNMVGDVVYVAANGLKKGDIGEATWSGTIMKARLVDDSATNELAGGAVAEIVEVSGNTLIIKPKP